MADSIQNRKNQQTYLRQLQQDKTNRKRELMKAQSEDIKSVRDYYRDQSKQVDTETAAAVTHIREEAKMMAEMEKQERAEKLEEKAEQKRIQKDQAKMASYTGAHQTSEKKNSRT